MEGESRTFFDTRFRPYKHIEHYYGDAMRQLFLAAAIILCVAIPVWGDLLPFGSFVEIAGALLFVLLAGLTSPHGRMIHVYDAIVSGIGALLLEYAAVSFYSTQSLELFLVREAAAVTLLFAFYFSVKTSRAIAQGKLGARAVPWEFEDIQE